VEIVEVFARKCMACAETALAATLQPKERGVPLQENTTEPARRRDMDKTWLSGAVLLMAAAFCASHARAEEALNDTQKVGRRLFEQSCGVCHTKPTLTSPLYGPALSKESLSGEEEALTTVISNGTPRMPGFKHNFEPTQIKAIAAYIKTMPVPPKEEDAAKPARGTRDVD
jgi:mono/diheme cytochrome c family protein